MLTRWLSVAVLAVVLAGGYAVSELAVSRPVLPTALAVLPADTQSASVTDWAGVRDLVGDDLDAAYRADYSTVSLLGTSADTMDELYGWSVRDAEWESFGQSDRGAGAVVQLDDDVDLARVRARLRDLGYAEPADAAGVWEGGNALVASVDATLSPMLSFVAVHEGRRQVVLSDQAGYAERMTQVLSGSVRSVGDREAVRSVGLELRSAVAANVHVGERGCAVMGFGDASASDQALARDRVAAVGGVREHDAVGLALVASSSAGGGGDAVELQLAMSFGGSAPLVAEASARAALARGEAVGQGGTFEERFRVQEADVRARTVVLEMAPAPGASQLLSDLGRGKLLPATCG